jgi:hypothetical protein
VGGQRHAPAALPPGKRAVTHCVGGWVGLRADLDGCEKSRSPDRPARSEWLYRLLYPDPDEVLFRYVSGETEERHLQTQSGTQVRIVMPRYTACFVLDYSLCVIYYVQSDVKVTLTLYC